MGRNLWGDESPIPWISTAEAETCNKISTKNNLKYYEVINVFRCRLSFIIRRLALLCIRGTRKAVPKIENDLYDEFVCFASKLI